MGSDIISEINISQFLPKYLSPKATDSLMGELDQFPHNINERMYTRFLQDNENIYQGDGLESLLVINLPDTKIDLAPSIVISNSCDISHDNERPFRSKICYTPIFNLQKYSEYLLEDGIKDVVGLREHVNDIKKQRITQIFFLPQYGESIRDSLVFLDQLNNSDSGIVYDTFSKEKRLFTLSQFGHYLFLFKLSIHFCRLNENQLRDE